MNKIGVIGATGRMGSKIVSNIIKDEDLILEMVISSDSITCKKFLQEKGITTRVALSINELVEACDIIIDFSLPPSTIELINIIESQSDKTFVIGTTGLDHKIMDLLYKVSKSNKVLYAQNMSIGIAIVSKIVSNISNMLSEYDIEILEAHHNKKKDSPSGTALMLGRNIANSLGLDFEKVMVCNRSQKRNKNEIGFASMRGGSICGDHHVNFFGENDVITVSHRVLDKKIFAENAITIAKILHNQDSNGLFSIEDILKI